MKGFVRHSTVALLTLLVLMPYPSKANEDPLCDREKHNYDETACFASMAGKLAEKNIALRNELARQEKKLKTARTEVLTLQKALREAVKKPADLRNEERSVGSTGPTLKETGQSTQTQIAIPLKSKIENAGEATYGQGKISLVYMLGLTSIGTLFGLLLGLVVISLTVRRRTQSTSGNGPTTEDTRTTTVPTVEQSNSVLKSRDLELRFDEKGEGLVVSITDKPGVTAPLSIHCDGEGKHGPALVKIKNPWKHLNEKHAPKPDTASALAPEQKPQTA